MNQQSSPQTSATEPHAPAYGSGLIALGSELLAEVQRVMGQSKVKALRVNLGSRHVKDFSVNPATAVATVLLVVLAVVVSNLRVEVIKD